jgi:uncharacterized membrane protein YjjP (DUF1212 family)
MHTQSEDRNPILPSQNADLLCSILDIGEVLLTSGAEIMRVEDTLTRICYAYGFTRSDVFTITSSIVITVHTAQGETLTQTRRVYRQNVNLDRVAKANALSRKLCADPLPLDALQQEIRQLHTSRSYPFIVEEALYAIVSAAFCLFFGGNWSDALAAFLSGALLRLVLQLLGPLKLNDILQSMLASFLTGLCVVGLDCVGLAQQSDKVMIGNIMLLIPGLLFTSSIRDMCNGDTLSGLLGICQSVLKATAVAVGFAAVMLLAGGLV